MAEQEEVLDIEGQDDIALVKRMQDGRDQIVGEIKKVIIGQEDIIDELLIALFGGGHVLVTGVPGLAKTLLIKTVADILQVDFSRIQFTPDLMPADVVGSEVVEESAEGGRQLKFVKGPIFTNILLADEINRTPPKTQSSLLEAMEERQVTAAGVTYPMSKPFFVLATQNPIELEGTYPLPEAQLDRFMFKIELGYLSEDDEVKVVSQTTQTHDSGLAHPLSGEDILEFQRIARQVPAAEAVIKYAVRLVHASRPQSETAPDFIKDWVSWGAGIRASQNLILAGKVRALLLGRYNVSYGDVRALAPSVLRHRVLLNFHAEAERVTTDDVIKRLLEAVPEPSSEI
ncbi:MAG: MoxR family ATPase [Pseudomonadales bacterium]|jgi:MoxR-like ATPase|nr:AAA family ATPase [Gammaproteobacteria bacterium]MBL6745744.1 MoxR family ATPase [Pseudomonadales bacterium]MBU13617.1 AAA family ATPase [Gammaproteobacteria bacterium]MCH1600936.1 MoxR family ATPase [Pseudomonadales bacterium]HAU24549.1 AAA family ATPase [Gammaproteobacteria bacterium]|tara:strand:- start:599 stop:1630 length:1032 start_codon:yes stop_codon:yes gene_type:complete